MTTNTQPDTTDEPSDTDPYQVMPELEGGEFDRLKADIAEHGVEYPIILDGDGEIIDGHHRYRAWTDLGRDPDDLPTRVVDDTDADNYHRAYRANLLRRDLADGTKREVVKQYLLEHPDRVAEDDQAEIAADLGVSAQTVGRAVNELEEGGNRFQVESLSTEEKRDQVREYVEDAPTVSNREVAREVDCDVTHVTVGNWRDEWDIEEPTTGLDTFTNTKAEADKALDVVDTATDEDADEEVRETAAEKAAEITDGKTSLDDAADEIQKEEHKVEAEQEDRDRREEFAAAVEQDAAVSIHEGDFADVLAEYDETINHIVTDPPYGEDAMDSWHDLGRVAAEVLEPSGLVVAYSGKHHLPTVINALDEHLEYFWQGIVVHKDAGARIWPRNIRTDYKPILVFQKPPIQKLPTLTSDVIDGAGAEKDAHDWQQATAEAVDLVEKFTEPNDHIVDPMCGSGTTGVAALETDRRVTLIDRDSEAIAEAERRCSDVL